MQRFVTQALFVTLLSLSTALTGCGPEMPGEDLSTHESELGPSLAAVAPVDFWVYSKLPLDAALATRFFSFAATHGVREIYIESQTLVIEHPAEFERFIADCSARGIKVAMLFGNHSWALAENHSKAVTIAQKAAAFVDRLYRNGRPRPFRINFDIEPHTLPLWKTDMNAASNQFLDLMNKLRVAIGPNLKFAITIPFWYDTRLVTRGAATRPLSELVIDKADWVVMMNYRDTSSRLISGATSEITYANSRGKQVVLGVNVNSEPDLTITFANETPATMVQVLTEVKNHFRGSSSFNGLAVYSYEQALDYF